MAEVIGAAILTAAGAGEIATGGTAIFGFTISGTAASTAVGTTAILAASIGLQLALSKAPEVGANNISLRQATAPRKYGYGRGRCGGVYALYEVNRGVSIDVLYWCQGPICGFVEDYLNDRRVQVLFDVDGKGVVQTQDDGAYQGGHVFLYNRLGLATETSYPEVVTRIPSHWGAAYRGDGCASSAVFAVSASQEQTPKTYPDGHPEPSKTIDFPAVWDPRDLAQDPDDPATWVDHPVFNILTTYAEGDRVLYNGCPYISAIAANLGNVPGNNVADSGLQALGTPTGTPGTWIRVSSNPVLQIIDYLTDPDHGMGLDRDTIITPVLAALMVEADLCDELVLRKDGDYEPRYTSNGWFNYETAPSDVINSVLATCDGWMTEDGDGTLALQVGVYRVPTVTFTDKHRLPGFSVAYGIADEQKINELTLKFVSPSHKYKEIEGQAWRDESDVLSRGKARSQSLDLPWVQSHAQGRRLAKRAYARLNPLAHGTFTTTLYGLAALGQRYVGVQFSFFAGLTDAVVEIQGAEVDLVAGKITWTWIKVDPPTIDAWNPATEEGREPSRPDDIDGETLPVPQNVAAVAGGDPPFHIDISWDDPEQGFLTWRVRYRLTDGGDGGPGPWSQQDFSDATIADGRVTVTIFPTTAADYELQAASKGSRGSISDWSESAFVSLSPPALVFSRAKNSGFLAILEDV